MRILRFFASPLFITAFVAAVFLYCAYQMVGAYRNFPTKYQMDLAVLGDTAAGVLLEAGDDSYTYGMWNGWRPLLIKVAKNNEFFSATVTDLTPDSALLLHGLGPHNVLVRPATQGEILIWYKASEVRERVLHAH